MVFDLIIIGGGPAGYLAAERAGQGCLNTLLIEKNSLGGVCLNEGCIPSKTLLYSAKLYEGAVHGEKYGISIENARLDHEVVVNRKNKVVRTLTAGIKAALRKCNVTVAEGTAVILGKEGTNGSEYIFNVKAGETVYAGRRLLIATGSVPVIPPVPGIEEGIEKGYVLTNREILSLKAVPSSLVVVGGGVIGLEMASYFNSAGSKVTVIEMLDHIAGFTDREIAGILMKNYVKKGVDFKLQARVTEIRPAAGSGMEAGDAAACGAEAAYETDTGAFTATAGKILVSVGRRAATGGLGLESIGVAVDRGRIVTDEYCRTNVPGVYAAGDVNGISMLAHTAYREAEVCVNHILGIEDRMLYDAIPSVIYTNPEAAGVGETEETARDKCIDYEVSKLPMMYSGRYAAENEGGDGICKALFEKGGRRLIGFHMLGNYSSEIIYGAGLMIGRQMSDKDISRLVFPHPTVSEIIKELMY